MELDYSYSPGTWDLHFDPAFTHANLTAADGTSTVAAIKTWLFDATANEYTGTWAIGKDGAIHAVRMSIATAR